MKKLPKNFGKMKGELKQAKGFSKDIVLIRAFAILMKDEHGQVIYTFASKKKADEFFKYLTTKGRQDREINTPNKIK